MIYKNIHLQIMLNNLTLAGADDGRLEWSGSKEDFDRVERLIEAYENNK